MLFLTWHSTVILKLVLLPHNSKWLLQEVEVAKLSFLALSFIKWFTIIVLSMLCNMFDAMESKDNQFNLFCVIVEQKLFLIIFNLKKWPLIGTVANHQW